MIDLSWHTQGLTQSLTPERKRDIPSIILPVKPIITFPMGRSLGTGTVYEKTECYARKHSWTPKDHQGTTSNVIILVSLYYKLELGLTHPRPTGQCGEAAPMLSGTGLYRKWEQVRGQPAWQVSHRMTAVCRQAGALKWDHEQSPTVWKCISNTQTNLWLLLGSS